MNSALIASLQDRLLQADRSTASRMDVLRDRQASYEALMLEVDNLAKEMDLLEKVEKTLQAVSGKVLGQSTGTIDKIVTAGLKVIFYDQKLEFKTVVDKYRGKTSIKFELYQDGQIAPLMDGYGGGILVVIGVLLRIAAIMILGQRRILFLDETLMHLSVEYHETAAQFLSKLCEKQNFTILAVTHQKTLASKADVHYEAKAGKNGTTLELVPKA